MSRFSHVGLDGGRVSHVLTAQAEASRAAQNPTTTITDGEQANHLAAYSRSLLDFHQKLWNDTRRKSELDARVSWLTESLPEFCPSSCADVA